MAKFLSSHPTIEHYNLIKESGLRMPHIAYIEKTKNVEYKYYDSKIEYLESTGVQYIDTLIIPAKMMDYEICFSAPQESLAQNSFFSLFGARERTNNVLYHYDFWYCVYPDVKTNFMNISFTLGNTWKDVKGNYLNTEEVAIIKKSGLDFYFNNSKIATLNPSEFILNKSIYLFRTNVTPADGLGGCKIYYARFFNDEGGIVADFIPVRIGNIGYMYDKISGYLFGNAGTGNFILGPDI